MARAERLVWLGVLALALMAAWTGGMAERQAAHEPPLARFEYRRVVMGAPCTLALYAPDELRADGAARAAFARLAEIEEALSDWMPHSEVRRLPVKPGVRVPIGRDLAAILKRSRTYFDATSGAFDPTVGPIVLLWREARRTGVLPEQAAIEHAMHSVGMRHVRLGENPSTYAADVTDVRLDFGGIGQGYAAAEALATLSALGINRAMIDLSGDIAASDAPPGSTGWRVAVSQTAEPGTANEVVILRHGAVTVSGDEFQHVDAAGANGGVTRYSHIVDPRTGAPLTTRTAVVLIATDPVDADALATAMCVLGPERGRRVLAQFPGASARWIRGGSGQQP